MALCPIDCPITPLPHCQHCPIDCPTPPIPTCPPAVGQDRHPSAPQCLPESPGLSWSRPTSGSGCTSGTEQHPPHLRQLLILNTGPPRPPAGPRPRSGSGMERGTWNGERGTGNTGHGNREHRTRNAECSTWRCQHAAHACAHMWPCTLAHARTVMHTRTRLHTHVHTRTGPGQHRGGCPRLLSTPQWPQWPC